MSLLLVCSGGGHLKGLHQMADRLPFTYERRTWVTFDTGLSRSLLEGEDVVWARYAGPRDIPNIARNGAAASIDIIRDDLESLRIERADVVLANLTGAVLVRYAAQLRSLVIAGGYLVVSGFAPSDVAVIQAAFSGAALIETSIEGEWAALTFRL